MDKGQFVVIELAYLDRLISLLTHYALSARTIENCNKSLSRLTMFLSSP